MTTQYKLLSEYSVGDILLVRAVKAQDQIGSQVSSSIFNKNNNPIVEIKIIARAVGKHTKIQFEGENTLWVSDADYDVVDVVELAKVNSTTEVDEVRNPFKELYDKIEAIKKEVESKRPNGYNPWKPIWVSPQENSPFDPWAIPNITWTSSFDHYFQPTFGRTKTGDKE